MLAKHEKLFSEMKTVADLKTDDKGYTLPWMTRRKNGKIEIASSAQITSEILGNFSLLVTCTKNGFVLTSIDKDCNRQLKESITRESHTVGEKENDWLSVYRVQWAKVEYTPRNWINEDYIDSEGMPHSSLVENE